MTRSPTGESPLSFFSDEAREEFRRHAREMIDQGRIIGEDRSGWRFRIKRGQLDLTITFAAALEDFGECRHLADLLASRSTPLVPLVTDGIGRFLDTGREFNRLLGYDCLGGRPFDQITHPGDLGHCNRTIAELPDDGEPAGVRKRYISADGTSVWFESYLSRFAQAHGEPQLLVLTRALGQGEDGFGRAGPIETSAEMRKQLFGLRERWIRTGAITGSPA